MPATWLSMAGTIRRREKTEGGIAMPRTRRTRVGFLAGVVAIRDRHRRRVTVSADQPQHGGGVDAPAESHDERSGRKVARGAVPVLVDAQDQVGHMGAAKLEDLVAQVAARQ